MSTRDYSDCLQFQTTQDLKCEISDASINTPQLTFFLILQQIYQRERAAQIREPSFGKCQRIKHEPNPIIEREYRIFFGSFCRNFGEAFRGVQYAICKGSGHEISKESGRDHIQTPTVFALSLKDLLVSRGKNFSRSSKIAVLSMEYLPSFQERIDRGTFLQRHELHSKSTKIQTRQIVSLSLGSAKPVSRNLS